MTTLGSPKLQVVLEFGHDLLHALRACAHVSTHQTSDLVCLVQHIGGRLVRNRAESLLDGDGVEALEEHAWSIPRSTNRLLRH